ncbi:asparaginase [Geosporobacter ferrireducens]|uniref:L-asparaginase n=1 Tax=Geosporobacter ferrireducens TaxID=1424294 RepID=A0A1D8GLC8_9FIRM|nr:asparaginase [Geosporobacter ferrireducens]AOT71716.1 L-asparaginase [Geosporobacter ferrireducens]MTI55492.1 asparaginase [Geosporobacter ferrireducens]
MEALAVVTRNDLIESVHYGTICVTNSIGTVLYQLGSPDTSIFFRSSAKPIQVIPLLQSGAAKAYNFSLEEIALACSSHSGQGRHQAAVQKMLGRLKLGEKDLHCGIMMPYNADESNRLISTGDKPSVFHCSCSGKHAAMLALASYKNLPIDTYEDLAHPVQQEILKTIADFAELDPKSIPVGIDGCGVPIYLLPIRNIAQSYGKLMYQAIHSHSPYHPAAKTVVDAMLAYPEMVSGDDEFCTDLMRLTHGKLIGKVGCEAVYCIGIRNQQLGVCIKIVDGNERAIYPVVIHLLKQLNVLDEKEIETLKNWYHTPIYNNLKEQIGEVVPVFDIHQPKGAVPLLGKDIKDF